MAVHDTKLITITEHHDYKSATYNHLVAEWQIPLNFSFSKPSPPQRQAVEVSSPSPHSFISKPLEIGRRGLALRQFADELVKVYKDLGFVEHAESFV